MTHREWLVFVEDAQQLAELSGRAEADCARDLWALVCSWRRSAAPSSLYA